MALFSQAVRAQIDMHCHMIPASYLEAVKAHGMEMDELFPIPEWKATAHLEFMDEAEIQTSVLTMSAPQPFFGDVAESAAICRKFNEEAAALKAIHPGRFLFCTALDRYHASPMMNEAAALREKYKLGGRQIRMFNPLAPTTVQPEKKTQTMNTTLTPRRQGLAVIASLEAKGEQAGLESALSEALNNGLTISEAKEALSQLYAYTGFPRSLNALGTLQKVLARREAAGIKDNPGQDADTIPADYDALKQGTEVQTQLTGKPFNYDFVPATDYYLKAHLFGDIFARNNLNFSDREIVTVSAISALPGCEPQLVAHVSGARNMGVTDEELRALPFLLEEKVGLAEAERLRGALATVLGDAHTTVQTVDFSVWPKGVLNPHGKYFTGNSYLAQLDGGLANVTFEPGCRNNWHIHHGAVQVLICVAGRGWYQEWGKPAVPMTPGTVIAIPAEIKHWHGAAADSWFQHLTYHTAVQEGSTNEGLEPVTEELYQAAK